MQPSGSRPARNRIFRDQQPRSISPQLKRVTHPNVDVHALHDRPNVSVRKQPLELPLHLIRPKRNPTEVIRKVSRKHPDSIPELALSRRKLSTGSPGARAAARSSRDSAKERAVARTAPGWVGAARSTAWGRN